MIQRTGAAAEAHAIALLQHVAVMCDETRERIGVDPSRIESMLEAFEQTLATLAPVLERFGETPGAALDAVLAAARHAMDRHQALLDAMALELQRLERAIAETDVAEQATAAYGNAKPSGTHPSMDVVG